MQKYFTIKSISTHIVAGDPNESHYNGPNEYQDIYDTCLLNDIIKTKFTTLEEAELELSKIIENCQGNYTILTVYE